MGLVLLVLAQDPAFFQAHCFECHDAETRKGGLDLSSLAFTPSDPENFRRWVKVHDRLDSGEMPPPKKPRPPGAAAVVQKLRKALVDAERASAGKGRTPLRRLTRAEYENTVRDLLDLPGIKLADELPPDGSAHGFEKNADALDLSHVNLAKYVATADHALDVAIATEPKAPTVTTMRTSLAYPAGFVAHVLMHGDGVLLRDGKPDPAFPPAGEQGHIDQGAHEQIGVFRSGATVGLFRHEDEAFHPYFNEFVALYPGRYRVRLSLWSFQWDKGQVLPARGTEAARLSVVSLTRDGRGGGHPSAVLAYLDAPLQKAQVHDLVTWFNYRDMIGFNAASLAQGGQTRGPRKAMGFTGPGIACDWLEYEGPLHDVWPPVGHRRLFGELPLAEVKPGVRPPARKILKGPSFPGTNRPDPATGTWSVHSESPSADADRLLGAFLPKAFRRPVDEAARRPYVAKVEERMKAGDCFETAMRWAYRAALCSADFLYHVEPAGKLDDTALACRLSYFLWNSMPDGSTAAGTLRRPEALRAETERLLKDPKSQRFIDDFLGQWLKLRLIASTDPDRMLYPEFSTYLQDSMVAETRAFFRELIEKDLDAGHLVRSDFAMLNEKLAVHYGVPGVSGPKIRRTALPPGCPRGGFLTQGSILKITANGTTTSPVTRGAFVMDRLLGRPPEPPPPNLPAVEPDVRGTTTIREQLEKHRSLPVCASCHSRMDPPGFALESFDVIGGFRERYRSIGEGAPAPRGAIDPFIGIGFKLGPPVDASGVLPDGRTFKDIAEFQGLLAADVPGLLGNLARQFLVYATGRPVAFGDRDELSAIVKRTQVRGGGIRTLIHEVIQSPLFQAR